MTIYGVFSKWLTNLVRKLFEDYLYLRNAFIQTIGVTPIEDKTREAYLNMKLITDSWDITICYCFKILFLLGF